MSKKYRNKTPPLSLNLFQGNVYGWQYWMAIKNKGYDGVSGYFYCGDQSLTSLKGCPEYVGGDFDCSSNELTSLEFCPKIVNGHFNCSDNEIMSLKHSPIGIEKSFICSYNKLKSLEFCPKYIGGKFVFSYNKIKELNINHFPLDVCLEVILHNNKKKVDAYRGMNFKNIVNLLNEQKENKIISKSISKCGKEKETKNFKL